MQDVCTHNNNIIKINDDAVRNGREHNVVHNVTAIHSYSTYKHCMRNNIKTIMRVQIIVVVP
jgi:hypothetical protein